MKEAVENQVTENQTEEVTEAVEEVIERPYNLRKLADADLFPLLQLLRKLGLKDFKDAFIQKKQEHIFIPKLYETDEERAKAFEKFQREVGIDTFLGMADIMISKIETHKDSIYEFYSNLSGVAPEEIMQMEFGTLPLMIYDSFSEVKNTAFFKVLSRLL
jgi:hypothetical protein